MCHLAMLEGIPGGEGTTWLEPATDEQYQAANEHLPEQRRSGKPALAADSPLLPSTATEPTRSRWTARGMTCTATNPSALSVTPRQLRGPQAQSGARLTAAHTRPGRQAEGAHINHSGATRVTLPIGRAWRHIGGYFACSGSAADSERDCRGRSDSWHGGLTNEPGPLPGSRNLANHGAPIDAYYATSRRAKVRVCSHHAQRGLPAAKRAAITPPPPLSPDGLPAPSRTRITAAADTVPAGRDDGAFRPGRR